MRTPCPVVTMLEQSPWWFRRSDVGIVGVLVTEVAPDRGVSRFPESVDVLVVTLDLAAPLLADTEYVPSGGERLAPGALVVGGASLDVLRQ